MTSMAAKPSDVNPSLLMCEWGAIRRGLPADGVDGGEKALWEICADIDGVELVAERPKSPCRLVNHWQSPQLKLWHRLQEREKECCHPFGRVEIFAIQASSECR
jgi:hypothetical protein